MLVAGSDTPVGKVIDGTLGMFATGERDSELELVLGRYPTKDWEPRGFTVGDRLLYDFESDRTTVFRRPTASSLS